MSISRRPTACGGILIRAAGFTALPSGRGAVVSSRFLGEERSEFSALPKARGALPKQRFEWRGPGEAEPAWSGFERR